MTLMEDTLAATPAGAAALEQARAQAARAVERPCSWRRCVVLVDPVDNTVIGGWGDALCPCDHLPGWNARHPEGMAKVGWSGKARGRHGSRIARSKARRREWARFEAEMTALLRDDPEQA